MVWIVQRERPSIPPPRPLPFRVKSYPSQFSWLSKIEKGELICKCPEIKPAFQLFRNTRKLLSESRRQLFTGFLISLSFLLQFSPGYRQHLHRARGNTFAMDCLHLRFPPLFFSFVDVLYWVGTTQLL